MLQLGHGVAAVETSGIKAAPPSRALLLQLGHGVAAVETWNGMLWCGVMPPRFNWATASPPWRRATAQEQTRRCFMASIGPRRRRRGDPLAVAVQRIGEHASIGPRRRRRGDPTPECEPRPPYRSFNWATASPPWRHRLLLSSREAQSRFNWATASPPWRPGKRRRGESEDALLQLGHGVAAVETWIRPVKRPKPSRASIGPRRRRRGDRCARVSVSTRESGFNWATASPPWRPHWDCGTSAPCRRFNWATASPPWRRPDPRNKDGANHVASIGPRRRRRGDLKGA